MLLLAVINLAGRAIIRIKRSGATAGGI